MDRDILDERNSEFQSQITQNYYLDAVQIFHQFDEIRLF